MKVLWRYIALLPQSRLNVWVLYIELDFGRSNVGECIRREPQLEVGNAGYALTLSTPLTLSALIAWV